MSRDLKSKSSVASRTDSIDRFLETALPMFPALDPDAEATVDRMMKLVKHVDRLTERTVSQMSAGALARRLSLSSGAMTNRLDHLEGDGFVARERDVDDRRSVQVRITPAGLDALTHAIEAQAEEESALVRALSPEDRRHLNDLLRQLVLSIEGPEDEVC
jgi:DNA-binding MarR family transcriptional regulator